MLAKTMSALLFGAFAITIASAATAQTQGLNNLYSAQQLHDDADFLRNHVADLIDQKAQGYNNHPDWGDLHMRIEHAKEREGTLRRMSITPATAQNVLAKDPIAHLPVATDWENPNPVKWKQMKSKDCKNGSFEEFGYRVAMTGRKKSIKLQKAIKKCKKAKVSFDEGAFETGYKRGAVVYCGFEMGITHGEDSYHGDKAEVCVDYPSKTYDVGYSYGLIKRQNGRRVTQSIKQAFNHRQIIEHYKTVWFPRPLSDDPNDWRADFWGYLKRDRERLTQEEKIYRQHRDNHPSAYKTFLSSQDPKPDSLVAYTIPTTMPSYP